MYDWLPYWRPCPRCDRRAAAVKRPLLRGIIIIRWWELSCAGCGLTIVMSHIRPAGFEPPMPGE